MLTVGLWMLVLGGCATDQSGQSLFDKFTSNDSELSEAEFEARLMDFAERFSVRVDDAVYPLALKSRSHDREALLLSLRSSEEAVRATHYADPMATFISLIVLCAQFQDYFTDGDGASMFTPESRAEIVGLFKSMQTELRELAVATGNEETVDAWAAKLREWSEANPITGNTMARTSPVPLFADLKRPGGKSLLAATATIERGMSELGQRIESLQAELPRMIVLRSALYVDLLTEGVSLPELMERIDRLVILAEAIPSIIDEQRVDTLRFAEGELTRVLETVDKERVAVLDQLEAERIAILEAVRAERVAIMDAIDAERRLMMADVETMRTATVGDVDVQRIDTLDRLDAMMAEFGVIIESQRASFTREIDASVATTVDASLQGAFWLTLKLLVAIFVGLAALIVLVRVLWTPRRAVA